MRNIIGYIRKGGLSLLLFILITRPTFAQTTGPEFCNGSNTAIKTAIGCIDTTPSAFVSTLFTISLGIGGGIAFLMILLGALQIQTSAGNPERLNQGREVIEGAIIGLLLIIFAVFILRVIGVDILRIPGFS